MFKRNQERMTFAKEKNKKKKKKEVLTKRKFKNLYNMTEKLSPKKISM